MEITDVIIDELEKQLVMCQLRSLNTKAMLLRATLQSVKYNREVKEKHEHQNS